MGQDALEELDASDPLVWERGFDAAAAATPGIDHFCSRSEWGLSFQRSFRPHAEPLLFGDGESFVALTVDEHPQLGRCLLALECMWGFGSPLVGPEPVRLLAAMLERLEEPLPLLLQGLPRDGPILHALGTLLRPRYGLRAIATTTRYVAHLGGGLDGFLSERSPAFRRNLRAAGRRAREAGLELEAVDVPSAAAAAALYPRLLAIEARSWKGAAGVGADQEPMRGFYREMLPRLAAAGRLRVLLARQAGEDVGYLHGGLQRDPEGLHFRGLQFSFDRRLAALSPGNLLQRGMIERLCAEGVASYDLGAQSDYKRRWGDEGLSTFTLLGLPRGWRPPAS